MATSARERDDATTLRFRTHPGAGTTTRAPAWQRVTRKIAKTLGAPGRKLTSSKRLLVADEAEKQTKTSAAALVSLRHDVNPNGDDNSVFHEPPAQQRDSELSARTISSYEVAISAHADAVSAHLSTIPAAYPLVQYVAECCAVLSQTLSAVTTHACPQSADDVEVALFLTSLRLRKWPLAQTLAVRLERRIEHQAQEVENAHRRRSSVRIPRRTSALEDDTDDAILRFLDSCAFS